LDRRAPCQGEEAELSQSAERIFAGDFIAEAEVKQAALAWVPEVMRFAAPPAADAAVETPPWEELPAEQPERGESEDEALPAEREEVSEAA
jgi:hypothetical protein